MDTQKDISQFCLGDLAISVAVYKLKNIRQIFLSDFKVEIEIIHHFAELLKIDIVVAVFVIFLENIFHCRSHNALTGLLCSAGFHGRIKTITSYILSIRIISTPQSTNVAKKSTTFSKNLPSFPFFHSQTILLCLHLIRNRFLDEFVSNKAQYTTFTT